jgi:mediator of RNA polymerase II transcription subunit 14
MPGRVVAVVSASTHSMVVNGKADSAVAVDMAVKREDDMAVGGTPGVNGAGLANGGALKTVPSRPASALGHESANGAAHSLAAQQLPPEIWNMVEGYESLGKLVGRVTQECFNDFSELVDKLASMTVDNPSPHFANGDGVNGSSSTLNMQKKLMLLNFANSNREKFIKLMVICQWSARVDQIKTLINLMLWSNDQTLAYEEAARQMGQLKIDLHPFKLPSPDIAHALEVLSTGRASWMPDVCAMAVNDVSNACS